MLSSAMSPEESVADFERRRGLRREVFANEVAAC
jgi:hypothetical protein